MASWKDTLRAWLFAAPRKSVRRPTLQVHTLEDRLAPVIGAWDVPYAVDYDTAVGATNLTGVVQFVGSGSIASGGLIDRGDAVVGSRYVLTAAHVQPQVGDVFAFYSRAADGTVKTIDIPITSVWIHPNYNPVTQENDIAIATLAAVAPQYAADYPIYLGAFGSEVGKPFVMAGYGLTGTGTSGQADRDLQRVSVTANGGQFQLVRPDTGAATIPLNFDATALDVQNALVAIGLSLTVEVPTAGPFKATPTFHSYEIKAVNVAGNDRRLDYRPVASNPLVLGGNNGTVDIMTLTNGAFDGEFQRLAINATSGTFRLGLNGTFTSLLSYDATAQQIQDALETLPGVTEVTVRLIPLDAPSGGGTFQISFDSPTGGFPVIAVNTANLTGTAAAYILQNDSRSVLRVGRNEYDGATLTFLTSDFDIDGTDQFEGQGDSGSPGFIDIGGGKLAMASVVSNGGFVFGDPEFNTRVSKYTAEIQQVIDAPGYAATVDMNYQLGGNDGVPDTFHVTQTADGLVQIYVKDSKNGSERLFYQDAAANMSSVVLRGTSDDDTFIVDSSVSVLVSVEGGGGKNTLTGPNLDTAWIINGADSGKGDTATFDINFTGIRAIIGGTKNDTFTFAAGGKISGSIDGGAGKDTIDFSPQTNAVVTVSAMGATDGAVGTIAGSNPLGGQFRNIDNIVGGKFSALDTLTGPSSGGTWTHKGLGGNYVDSVAGKSFQYSNFEVLTGGTGNDTFNIQSASVALTINGGAGSNASNVVGTAGNESIVMSYLSAAGDAKLTGLVQPISFSKVATINFDGTGGVNSYRFQDQSGVVRGTPVNPASGIVYSASGQHSGTVRVGSQSSFGVIGINGGLTVDGGSVGSTFLVLGTSGIGLQSGFGEAVLNTGRDTITVADTGIAISSFSAGDLLGVTPAVSLGTPTFSTIYVAGGNEPMNQGDVFIVTPSYSLNLVVDGQGPSTSSRPGDRVTLVANSTTTNAFVNDPALGPPQNRITQSLDGASVGLVNIEAGTPPSPGQGMIAVATDAGPLTTIQVYDRTTGALRYTVIPFQDFYLGASVGSGDVNGDGIADLVVGAGPGGGPRVAVFNGIDGSLMADFFAYEESFRGGVNVSTGDFNNDGHADLVLGTGVGGGPRVRILSGADYSPIRDVFVYESTFRGGVNVSAGDFNADGTPDLITSAGSGGGPRVVVLSGTDLSPIASFFAFDPNSRTGFYAAGGDVNGDGYADVIAGAGAGDPAHIRVISGLTRTAIADFYVNDPLEPGAAIPSIQFDAGVRVAAADVNGDGIDDVITGKGPGSLPTVRVYQIGGVNPVTGALFPTLAEIMHFDAFDGASSFGLYVGGSN